MQAYTQLNKLNRQLGGSISQLDGDRILQCHNSKGVGKVMSVALDAGISYTEYNLKLKDDTQLDMEHTSGPVLYFIYVLKGSVSFAWQDNPVTRKRVEELQTVILGSKAETLSVHVKQEAETCFAIIKVETTQPSAIPSQEDISLNQQLFHQFLTLTDLNPYEYYGTFNFRIKEQLLQIRAIKDTGLVRKLMIKSIIHFALALELGHHRDDMQAYNGLQTRLSKGELLLVKKAIDTITKKPERGYTVTQLCREYGLSSAKLQEGFKALEGHTIANFIRKKRVEMAERLLKEGELNISEIVYTIGFTSRSYFSKIFRKRYNCTPKYYQENCKKNSGA